MGVILIAAVMAGISPEQSKPCGRPLIRMPLTMQAAHAAVAAQATTGSGYVLAVVRDTEGWDVTVHRRAVKDPTDSLLYPQRRWHGTFPCQVQPTTGDLFADVRHTPVRGTRHRVCLRLLDAQVKEDAQGYSRFTGGWLEVSWEDGSTERDGSRRGQRQ